MSPRWWGPGAAAAAALLFLGAAEAAISCYSCGITGPLCDPKYEVVDADGDGHGDSQDWGQDGPTEDAARIRAETANVQINCTDACIKFDGTSEEDGKRVIIRDCYKPSMNLDTNDCKADYEFHGAVGTMCQCNAARCNGAGAAVGAPAEVAAAAAVGLAFALLAASPSTRPDF